MKFALKNRLTFFQVFRYIYSCDDDNLIFHFQKEPDPALGAMLVSCLHIVLVNERGCEPVAHVHAVLGM